MAVDLAVRVDGLGKRYRIGSAPAAYATLRETATAAARAPFLRAKAVLKGEAAAASTHEFWALRNVSFEVPRGQVLGVIGRNGAGKSTLLKVLSRVTEPTEGSAYVSGRLGALLEVGTGFHPELTGRENIYLNGSILGMRRREIERRMDEIIDFSSIGDFLDTPVKRYSSGMYVRLAFSIAAHLEPDVLVVDEVLAVGDASFQRRCLGRMRDVTGHGRTVLFVSHNMAAIRQLCEQSVWIDGGTIREWGPTDTVVAQYLRSQQERTASSEATMFDEDPSLAFQVLEVRLQVPDGEDAVVFDCDRAVRVRLRCVAREAIRGMYGYLEVRTLDGATVLVSDSYDTPGNPLEEPALGEQNVEIDIPARSLAPGDYELICSFASATAGNEAHLHAPGVIGRFALEDTTSVRGASRRGYFSTLLNWRVMDAS